MDSELAEGLARDGHDSAAAARREATDTRWRTIFEDRHGSGAYERLLGLFRQPCLSFADIAGQFGVSRERVRQWHVQLLPDAPQGHQRQRLCALLNHKRRLLADPVFRSFYQHARPHFERGRIELVKANEGYRSRSVRIDQRLIGIRDASRSAVSRSRSGSVTYRLTRCRGTADFIYYRLTTTDFLFLPAHVVPAGGSMFSEGGSKYHQFRNTFEAFHTQKGIPNG